MSVEVEYFVYLFVYFAGYFLLTKGTQTRICACVPLVIVCGILDLSLQTYDIPGCLG